MFGCTNFSLQDGPRTFDLCYSIWHFSFFLVAACRIFSCSMWDLAPWLGIEPRPPALGVQSLSHWTIREVPLLSLEPLELRHQNRVGICPGLPLQRPSWGWSGWRGCLWLWWGKGHGCVMPKLLWSFWAVGSHQHVRNWVCVLRACLCESGLREEIGVHVCMRMLFLFSH